MNNSDIPVSVPYVGESRRPALDLHLYDAVGTELIYSGVTDPLPWQDYRLSPGDTALFPLNVSAQFGITGDNDQYPGCLPVGNYTVEMTYMNQFPLPPLHFEVLKATPEDSVFIFEINKAISTTAFGEQGFRLTKQAFDHCRGTKYSTLAGAFLLVDLAALDSVGPSHLAALEAYIDECPSSCDLMKAFGILAFKYGNAQLRSTLSVRTKLPDNQISRYQLKLALQRLGNISLYEELTK